MKNDCLKYYKITLSETHKSMQLPNSKGLFYSSVKAKTKLFKISINPKQYGESLLL